ncbi:MAG: hypothetical protein ACFFD2_18165 [Promethearchaeota archaeon]
MVENPYAIFLLYFLITLPLVGYELSNSIVIMGLWAFLMPILTFSTSFNQTRFLGQPERYMEYGLFPLAIFTSYLIVNYGSIFLWMIYIFCTIFSIFLLTIKFKTQKKDIMANESKKREDLYVYINSLPIKKILPIPLNFGNEIAYKTKHRILYWCGVNNPKLFDDFVSIYPYPNDINFLKRIYGLDLVVIEQKIFKKFLKKYPHLRDDYDFSKYRLTFDNNHFKVYST